MTKKGSVPSSAKLVRPQRTRTQQPEVELPSVDLYDIDSDAPVVVGGGNNVVGSKDIAQDAETQLPGPSSDLGLGGATPCILEHSNSVLPSGPPKVIISPELRAEMFALKYWRGLLQTTFLSGDKNPKEEAMQAISGHLYYMEDNTDLQCDLIRESKIRRALMEVLKLDIVPGESKFRFKSRLQRLLDRCNKVVEREKITAKNTEKSLDESGHSTTEPNGSAPDTRTMSNTSSLSLKVNSQPKRKRDTSDHVIEENKRIRKAPTVIAIDSDDEDESPQDSSQDQSHQHKSHRGESHQDGTSQHRASRPRRTQRKSVVDKEEFRKQVDQDFKWINDTKVLVKDARELVEELLPILVKQEEQVFEQSVKVKALSQQLNSIKDFLNECGAQEEKITMRWQNR